MPQRSRARDSQGLHRNGTGDQGRDRVGASSTTQTCGLLMGASMVGFPQCKGRIYVRAKCIVLGFVACSWLVLLPLPFAAQVHAPLGQPVALRPQLRSRADLLRQRFDRGDVLLDGRPQLGDFGLGGGVLAMTLRNSAALASRPHDRSKNLSAPRWSDSSRQINSRWRAIFARPSQSAASLKRAARIACSLGFGSWLIVVGEVSIKSRSAAQAFRGSGRALLGPCP